MKQNYLENSLNLTIGDWLKFHQNNLHFKQEYRGLKFIKNPFECLIYEEILEEVKPDLVIEIGSASGGAYYGFMIDCR